MEALRCIMSRGSVRSFTPSDIPENVVNDILEAAIQAPCAGNVQEWRFVVVRNPGNRKRLAEAAFEQGFVGKAPVVVVACADLREAGASYGERGQSLYSVQDAAAATENLILAAWNRGIGSCWIGSFNEQKVKDILVLPGHVRPLAIIPMGYPAAAPRKPQRKKLSEVVHKEFY